MHHQDYSLYLPSESSLHSFHRKHESSTLQRGFSLTDGKLGQDLGWKNILLVQFQRQFIYAVYAGILASYCIVLYELGTALAVLENEHPLTVYMTESKGIVYACDAFFFVDVILMIIFKNTEWPEYSHRYKPRNVGILMMELFTLIPIDGIYYTVAQKKQESAVALLRLRYALRVIRLFYDQRIPSPMTKAQSMIRDIVKLLITVGLICCTLGVVLEPYLCSLKCSPSDVDDIFLYFLYVASEKITGKGFGKIDFHDKLKKGYAIQVFNFIGLMAYLAMGFVISKAICMYISKDNHIYSYLTKYKSIKEELNNWKSSNYTAWKIYEECLIRTIEAYYKMNWNKQRWYVTKAFEEEVLPKIMFKEVYLDMSWNAFKHSHLFKNQEVHFLREVSSYIQHVICAPGEVLCGRNLQKPGMIYIKTGVVQILSEENGETPIISFSGGSCLGESTLIIGYRSNWSVVCKTHCELCYLKRSDFVRVGLIYPREYRRLIKVIYARYDKARRYRKLSQYQWRKLLVSNPDTITMIWLKRTLQKLVENDGFFNYKEDENLVFCPDYLNLLVITDDIQLVVDRIFLKKKFPSIFQPESIVLDGWNIFIGIVAFLSLLSFPIYFLNCNELSKSTHVLLLSIITFIWCADLYIQSSTAIRTKESLLSSIPLIIYYRLTNTSFLIDIFSSVPFSVFFSFIDGDLTYEILLLTEIHKLLKIYRLQYIFTKLETLRLTNKVILKYFKILLLNFFLFYYTSLVFYYILCNIQNGCSKEYLKLINEFFDETRLNIMLHLFTISSTFLCNMTYVDLLKYIRYNEVVIIIILQLIYAVLYVFIISYICIMETLREREIQRYKEFVVTMDVVLKDLNVNFDLQKRIKLYLMDHFWVNKGLRLLNPLLFQNSMSFNLFSLTSQIRYGKLIENLPLFAELDEEVIIDVTRKLRLTHYPPGEVITYAGEVCKEMHVLEFGFCKVLGNLQNQILQPSESFCVIETCMQIPTFYTIVTLTDCNVLSLSYIDYARLATKHHDFGSCINNALLFVSDEEITKISTYKEIEMICEEVKVPFCIKFKLTSTLEKMRYGNEFGTYSFFMKYFLMKKSFPPNGKFLFYWEISRMIFAFATNIFTGYAYTLKHPFPYYFCLCMDITAWIDLYIRHHVCYYNEDGIQVSHPAKTSVNYWKNGLLIDFISCAPFDYIFGNQTTKSYLKLNRFLQLYRPFCLIKYINNNNISRSTLYDFLKYIPFAILFLDFLSNIGIYTTCSSPIDINLENVSCTAEHWAKTHLNHINISSVIKQHAASLVVATTSFTMITFHRLNLRSKQELFNFCVMVILGQLFFIWVAARIVSNIFYNETDLTAYQEAMRNLLTFVASRKIDKNIKNEIISYYEFMWKKTKGKNLVLLLNSFSTAIKEDILYDMFGRSISTSSIFLTAPKSFFKSLLLESKYEVYIHKGIIYRVNDVHGFIYILLKGTIDVLGADYNKLLILSPGSVFGNLDNCAQSRQTLTMVAKGHVEVIKISSLYFHSVISKYPLVRKFFYKHTRFNVDFIENEDNDLEINYSTTTIQSKTSTISGNRYDYSQSFKPLDKFDSILQYKPPGRNFFKKIIKNNNWIKSLRLILIIITCFFSFHLEMYQLGSYNNNIHLICILYFFDLLYLIKIYLDFCTTYVDEIGLRVNDLKLIRKRYINNRLGFYFDLITIIPIELFSLFFITQSYFWIVFIWFRKNRLIRIIYFFYLLKESQAKLHVNVKAVRIVHIISWLTIILQTMSALLLMSQIIENSDKKSKLYLLFESFEMITFAASGTSLMDSPLNFNIFSIIIILLIMWICKFLITLVIGELCSLIENVYQNTSRYRIYALYLKYQLKEEDVTVPLCKRIGEYLNLLWVYHRGVQYPSLLNQAPYYLKEAILNAMYGFHLRRHPLIKHCHTDLIRQMTATFDVLIFFPGNFVTYIGDIDGCMYFIHKGEIEVLVEDTLYAERVVDTLVTGDCFGLDQGLYTNCAHDYSYKVTKKSVIIALNKEKWFYLLQFFPASKTVLFDLRNAYMQNYYW